VILPGLSPKPHMVPAASLRERLDEAGIGDAIFALAAEIYPICRSITGDGVRSTLAQLGRHIDLEVHEVPTGIQVFGHELARRHHQDAEIGGGTQHHCRQRATHQIRQHAVSVGGDGQEHGRCQRHRKPRQPGDGHEL
jgi:hypothetical protein